MKAGVSTRPCGVTKYPRRAAPSFAVRVKEKGPVMTALVMVGLVPAIHGLRYRVL
jgi:hypothetical protein